MEGQKETEDVYKISKDNAMPKSHANEEQDMNPDRKTSSTVHAMPKPSTYEDQYEHFQCFKKKGMHFIHLNVRSLLPKVSEIRLIARQTKATVISITETWLDNIICDAEIDIEGYTILRKDRNRNGGGVCMYISSKYAYTKVDHQSDDMEAIWADIHLPNTKPITVGTIYRPPNDRTFIDNFEECLSKLKTDNENIILGNFNICLQNNNSVLYNSYKDVLNIYGLSQIIKVPTRLSKKLFFFD